MTIDNEGSPEQVGQSTQGDLIEGGEVLEVRLEFEEFEEFEKFAKFAKFGEFGEFDECDEFDEFAEFAEFANLDQIRTNRNESE